MIHRLEIPEYFHSKKAYDPHHLIARFVCSIERQLCTNAHQYRITTLDSFPESTSRILVKGSESTSIQFQTIPNVCVVDRDGSFEYRSQAKLMREELLPRTMVA
ncbi:hypothetical protein PILCRDRAFT_825532 [Piloderma croceum F 1598]|uniref:Uncharacterized protein n=1 Tax=Piloderma croceum (strain F 1598) TaxID=765440 RepID=A0A0C3BIK8_PILCF|nr:hypothetical protein PILCRDRAFT_825532 [Piloderma croceum F 1598]